MRIAFFGWHRSFGFHRIGGADSLVRRLTMQLANAGDVVDHVQYGTPEGLTSRVGDRISLRYFRLFGEALDALGDRYDHVVTYSVLARDRPRFAVFRRHERGITRVHKYFAGWPDSWVKRNLMLADARLVPFSGRVFVVSQRQYEGISSWARNATLLWPPVPDDYFLTPAQKPYSDRLRVTFLGRLDTGKGIHEVIDLFQMLRGHPDVEMRICGFTYPGLEESFVLHKRLMKQGDIVYKHVDHAGYSPGVGEAVRRTLRDTDVLLLPYRRLSSTMDTPMLLLEGMASLCAVLTKPLGDITRVYGKSPFLIGGDDFVRRAAELIGQARGLLSAERERLAERSSQLCFRASIVAEHFREALSA